MKILSTPKQILVMVLTLFASSLTFVGSVFGANVSVTDAIGVYIDAPHVQGSYIAEEYPSKSLTDNFENPNLTNSYTSCPITGPVGSFFYGSNECLIIGGEYFWPYGGAITESSTPTLGEVNSIKSDSVSTGGNGTTITLNRNANYVGFWWSAGSYGNTVSLFQGNNLLLEVSANDICGVIGGNGGCGKPDDVSQIVTAINNSTYIKDDYYGHPLDPQSVNMAPGEPFTYVHFFAQNSLTFDKIKFSGPGFEFDNLTIADLSGSELTPSAALVPVGSYGSTHLLTYDYQDEQDSVGTQTLVDGGNVKISSAIPSRSGYVFQSWNTESDGSGTNYWPNSNYPELDTVTDNATLFAQWTPLSDLPSCNSTSQTNSDNDIFGNTAYLPAGNTVVAFTGLDNCNWTVPDGVEHLTYVVVGGGGGGGSDAAGGGAGGAVETGSISVSSGQIITVNVGAGGSGGGAGAEDGFNGEGSNLYVGNQVVNAEGGGFGSRCGYNGINCTTNIGGRNGTAYGSGGNGTWLGSQENHATSGSDGVQTSITGVSLTLGSGGGGGGGAFGEACFGGQGGYYSGGFGFGGYYAQDNLNGCLNNSLPTGGLPNTGGGGGGGDGLTGGANGADGIVIIRYQVSGALNVYLDAPQVQGSYISELEDVDSLTDNYNSTGIPNGSDCPVTGNVGTYSFIPTNCQILTRENNDWFYPYGGALTDTSTPTSGGDASNQSDSVGVFDSDGTTISLNRDVNYVGFWWSAGSLGNTVSFYQDDSLLLTISADDICSFVRGSGDCLPPVNSNVKLTALNDTTQYSNDDYYGHPLNREAMDSSEPFTYVHVFAQNSITFNKIKFATTGNGFEFDNLTVALLSGSDLKPRETLVPVGGFGATSTLLYDSQGGSQVPSQTLVNGGNVAITSTKPSKAGYNFVGWTTQPDGSGDSYLTSSNYPASGTVSGDGALYAQWQRLYYTVYYPLDGFNWSNPYYDDPESNRDNADDISIIPGSMTFDGDSSQFENPLTYNFKFYSDSTKYVSKYEVYDDCGNRLPDISMEGLPINFETYLSQIDTNSKTVNENLAICAKLYFGSDSDYKVWPDLFMKKVWTPITVTKTITNGDFETNTGSGFRGWTVMNQAIDLGVTEIAGCQSVDLSTYSNLGVYEGSLSWQDEYSQIKNSDEFMYLPPFDTPEQNNDSAASNSDLVFVHGDGSPYAPGAYFSTHTGDGNELVDNFRRSGNVLQLESDMLASGENNPKFLPDADPNPYEAGSGFVVHGPAVFSDVFAAKTIDDLSIDWAAYHGNDDYAVFAYLLNIDTCQETTVIDSNGGASPWQTVKVAVPKDGNYRFVFVGGTYDNSWGGHAGAYLYIDNVKLQANPERVANLVSSGVSTSTSAGTTEVTTKQKSQKTSAIKPKSVDSELMQKSTLQFLVANSKNLEIIGIEKGKRVRIKVAQIGSIVPSENLNQTTLATLSSNDQTSNSITIEINEFKFLNYGSGAQLKVFGVQKGQRIKVKLR